MSRIKIPSNKSNPALRWAIEEIGADKFNISFESWNFYSFEFEDERDATAFMLRWY